MGSHADDFANSVVSLETCGHDMFAYSCDFRQYPFRETRYQLFTNKLFCTGLPAKL